MENYCYECPKVFDSREAMTPHNRRVHKKIYKRGVTKTCPKCGSWLRNQAFLEDHLATEHKPGWEPHLSDAEKEAKEKAEKKIAETKGKKKEAE